METFNGVPYITDRADSDQENDWLEGDEWWTEPMRRYRYGECHALALALCMERPEWTLAAFDDFDHVLALTPDGVAVDIEGTHDMGEAYHWSDFSTTNGLRPIEWEELTDYIGRGYSHPLIDVFTRLCARRVLKENGL